jgi:hypothetical protein
MGFSLRVFSLVFGLVYTAAHLMGMPLWRYYPLVDKFSTHDLVDLANGPSMNWYGWQSYGLIAGVICAVIIPRRIGNKIPAAVFYVLPIVILVCGFYTERQWFIKPPAIEVAVPNQ